MGKARDKAGKRGAAGQHGADKARERSERARLRKDRQRNSVYSSSAHDKEFEAQVPSFIAAAVMRACWPTRSCCTQEAGFPRCVGPDDTISLCPVR